MEQSNFQFALPTIGTNEMSRNDQGALIVNQATAAIVSAHLNHTTESLKAMIASNDYSAASLSGMRISESELVDLINSVQGALKSF